MSATQDRLDQLCDAVTAWRDAKCSFPRGPLVQLSDLQCTFTVTIPGTPQCDGENHLENCVCELARQDLIHVHDVVTRTR